MTTPPNPIEAFLTTLERLPADAPTACEGWTAHEVAAHLAAGIEEVAELIEDTVNEAPPRTTRGFEEREAPYREMDDADVRQALVKIVERANTALGAQAAKGVAVPFFERHWSAEEMQVHAANEFAMHRWDLIGDDELTDELLSPLHATESAIKTLNTLKVLEEAPTPRAGRAGLTDTRVVLRCPDQPDIALDVTPTGVAALELSTGEPFDGDVLVETDTANRLLTLWGRRSSTRTITITGDPALLPTVTTALWQNTPAWSPQRPA
ncbi:maleylpyruvate isomerase N-terminal domain-containing protein [Pseudonocardia spinosispora]|uniref:maleylpyruvate isomerase N-terminal domain-containing protein n=1 Tax=Pseudonocardia spinosispora TaxID=103441 RepID=UPI0003FFABEA|nr:maleylpyruvate isomerase N-terminal domain-containing protein [Pseudonocardia spinosispora]